jgi:plastocyanin
MVPEKSAKGRRAGWRVSLSASVLLALACGVEDVGAPVEGTVFVSIRDNLFQPETVTVQQGGSVRWTNDGAIIHSVVQDSGKWQSPLMSPRMWFDVRFDSLGTFSYHCSLHPEMTGAVIVQ